MQRTAIPAEPLSEWWDDDGVVTGDDNDDEALFHPTNIQSFTRAENNTGYIHRRPAAQTASSSSSQPSSSPSTSSPQLQSSDDSAPAATSASTVPRDNTSTIPKASATPATASDAPNDTKMCRICLDEDDQSDLISPCKCKGSMRYVHKKCLEQWRESSTGTKSFYQCDQCQYRYQFRTRNGIAKLLSSKVTLHVITLLLFLVAALVGGYVAKLLDFLTGSSFHYTLQELTFEAELASLDNSHQQQQILREYYAHRENFIHPMSWSDFVHVDIIHMLFGLVSMGVTGFLSLLISISAGGSFFFNAFRLNSFRNNQQQKGGIECVVLVVIVVIGLVRCVSALYKFVERRADYVLKNATYMVENVT